MFRMVKDPNTGLDVIPAKFNYRIKIWPGKQSPLDIN